MSGYIIVENLNKSVLCKNVTSKFKLLCLTYGFPCQVRYDKGPHFRSRSYLPSLDDTVDINKGKAAREMNDLVIKNATKNHKPLKPLSVGDLCYRRHFDGKKTLRIESLCEVIEVCKSG